MIAPRLLNPTEGGYLPTEKNNVMIVKTKKYNC